MAQFSIIQTGCVCLLMIFLLDFRQKLSIMLLFSDSCAVSTRNDFLSIDFWAELAMSDSTVYLCSYREYHWSNLGFHIIKDHIITNEV
ncbi:hypothetical protein NC653_021036 [Populus alba x Populus x berolinensis]|uniref:Uncharacterized protein n=1 Tax=Populus alba x Populus x berolinensis TaxID=444605 RepID=A0AAD6MLX8_9ROSI|nr:hypothetical protein NC653_021036 [Populus alba x Populus x berolinensis]